MKEHDILTWKWNVDLNTDLYLVCMLKWKAVTETATKYGGDVYLTKNLNLCIF